MDFKTDMRVEETTYHNHEFALKIVHLDTNCSLWCMYTVKYNSSFSQNVISPQVITDKHSAEIIMDGMILSDGK